MYRVIITTVEKPEAEQIARFIDEWAEVTTGPLYTFPFHMEVKKMTADEDIEWCNAAMTRIRNAREES